MHRIVFWSGSVLACWLLSACSDSSGGAAPPAAASGQPANNAPLISGTPPAIAAAGQEYLFVPTASDPDDDRLSFSGDNIPSWLQLDRTTGTISGEPGEQSLGEYSGIRITASDGTATTSLEPFSITVVAVGENTATVSWIPPTARTDGSQLSNLAGYRIYFGQDINIAGEMIELRDTSLTRLTIDGLTEGQWYFRAVAFDSENISSPVSPTVSGYFQ